MPSAAAHWFEPPRAGDIVWCRFPHDHIPGPGPKPRPVLVLRVGEADGHPVVLVTYGTSQKVNQLYAGEFSILPSDGHAFAASGLDYPTKFNLGKTFELDYNQIWFSVPSNAPYGQTPKLGVLHPSLLRRAAAAANAARRGTD